MLRKLALTEEYFRRFDEAHSKYMEGSAAEFGRYREKIEKMAVRFARASRSGEAPGFPDSIKSFREPDRPLKSVSEYMKVLFMELNRYGAMFNLVYGFPRDGERLVVPYRTSVGFRAERAGETRNSVISFPQEENDAPAVLGMDGYPIQNERIRRLLSSLVCYYTFVPVSPTNGHQFKVSLKGISPTRIEIPSRETPDYGALTMRLYESALGVGELFGTTPVFSSYDRRADRESSLPSLQLKDGCFIPTVQAISFEEGREPNIVEESANSLVKRAQDQVSNMVSQLFLDAHIDIAEDRIKRLERDLR